ncbi:MAG: KpsF/GutQ family sugar-phosphate isomerase [Luminiphilus sp.]|nr:KpsF/GutQ family sugar-phosphate isomerase [Luminiphilus sp.]
MLNDEALLTSGRRTLTLEGQAVTNLAETLSLSFAAACQLILETQGRVIVTGMGKSGHIAHKIAATLASTGTPAFFVHPGEASHGDMGMITQRDTVLALSNSGTTPEVLTLLPLLKRLGVRLVSMTGHADSALACASDVHIDAGVDTEACPLDLAPTSSTTAALAMGDALAIALLESRGFTEEDFAFSHPGGALGKRLLLRVEDLMTKGADMPLVGPNATLAEALMEITAKGLGMTIVGEHGQLKGVFTDGDLRRALEEQPDINSVAITKLMSASVKTLPAGHLAAEAMHIMEQNRISSLVVTDSQAQIAGVIHLMALLKAGIN